MNERAKEGIIRSLLVLRQKLGELMESGEVNRLVMHTAIEYMRQATEEIEKVSPTEKSAFLEAVKEL